jgi:translation initiation factor 2A
MFKGGKPSQRYVPGGGVPGAPPKGDANGGGNEDKKKRVRSKRPLKESNGVEEAIQGIETLGVENGNGETVIENTGGEDEVNVKKLRNLSKKVIPSRASVEFS